MHSQEFSERESLQRLAEHRGDLFDTASEDFAILSRILTSADGEQMHEALMEAASQADISEDHVIGAVGPEGLNLIGSTLMRNLEDAGAGGGTQSRILAMVPGLLGEDPDKISPTQVISLIKFTSERYPEALARTAEEIARSEPSLLQFIIGQQALRTVGAKLAKMTLEQKPA